LVSATGSNRVLIGYNCGSHRLILTRKGIMLSKL
jgi:hypothetical protein